MACGEVGLTIDYFYRAKEEAAYKDKWERARWQMFYSLVAFQGADKIKVTDVLLFPWETEIPQQLTDKKPKSYEEQKAFWDKIDKKESTKE